ncbi:MAG: hypothetical protein AAGI52_10690 [Bacteroidota bacterium]
MTRRLYHLFLATGAVFALSLAMAVLDSLGWLVLPQPFRLAIPLALVLSAFFGIVMLSASLGSPAKMRQEMEEAKEATESTEETPPTTGETVTP